MTDTKRVRVANPFVGIVHMQVCAVKDASDDEILAVCNRENPAGTSNGWGHVCRDTEPHEYWGDRRPVPCADDKERVHFLVAC